MLGISATNVIGWDWKLPTATIRSFVSPGSWRAIFVRSFIHFFRLSWFGGKFLIVSHTFWPGGCLARYSLINSVGLCNHHLVSYLTKQVDRKMLNVLYFLNGYQSFHGCKVKHVSWSSTKCPTIPFCGPSSIGFLKYGWLIHPHVSHRKEV